MSLATPSPVIIDLTQQNDGTDNRTLFAQDVRRGLSKKQKTLSSRYFYDGQGSQLFQQIMNLPEYYLTRCEHEIFSTHQAAICRALAQKDFFHLIDLGAGDALKTKILLKELARQEISFAYIPVDISGDAMQSLTENFRTEMPEINLQAVVGEYFASLAWLHENKPGPKVIMFLGSNIGNFSLTDSIAFLQGVRRYLQPGDQLFLGADLRKDPQTILSAYDDAAGVTAEFNLNLLRRINSELGGNFAVEQFKHYALYNPLNGAMQSFLISQVKQEVYIQETGET
ncbi:MAG: L-histidine N(alpha)-methyltransferase, partial [Cytophagales bacterium CG18_big_fil_WC_8_21_14_2_50_42_9]